LERCQDSDAYRIGVRAFEIGSIYIRAVTPEFEARPIMAKLVKETGQTANLGVLEQGEVVHLAVVAPDRPVRYWAAVGKREAPHYSGLGKALLAALSEDELTDHLQRHRLPRRTPTTICDADALRTELARVRSAGWAIDDEESNTGVCCVAAPIFDQFGEAVAAVSISGLKAEFSSENLPRYIAAVVRAGAAVSQRLGSNANT
jgi:IclR family acetate operon transcriptional repressor